MPGSSTQLLTKARLARIAVLSVVFGCCVSASALGAGELKLVSYHGYRALVPRAWPVYDLAKDPGICVRFNRHAVYLGRPGANERCPAHAAGRTEAILLEPAPSSAAIAAAAGPQFPSSPLLAGSADGASGSLLDRAHAVLVTATWNGKPNLIRRALRLRSLSELSRPARPRTAAPARPALLRATAASVGASATPGEVYTGPGFDVCSTPSYSQMSAWGSSPYRAIGIYIGGVNRACAQPNLSATWVSSESVGGWHLIPIYVGLQAPANSCGCAAISRSSASSQGTAAAVDAVNQAQALGIGTGNPIYFDMEAYARGATNSSAVLAFLASWTTQLHAEGYKSGVYSSDYSGISDLVSEWGTSYVEPDEIWVANWNGLQSTSDANVPAPEWANHQRLHQYNGGHNETHGGVTLNIDGDYLDAATGAAGSAASPAGDPSASAPPTIAGTAAIGQTLTEVHGSWSNTPTSYTYQWEDCNPAGISCIPVIGATGQTYAVGAPDVGHTIRVIETASNAGGIGPPAASAPTGQVMSPVPLYWLYTAYGNVYPSPGTVWYGAPVAGGYRGRKLVGMAATPDGKGYWAVIAAGCVYAYGDAPRVASPRHGRPIKGIVSSPGGGYWLYTAYGNLYSSPGTVWYGSPKASGYRGSKVVGMAATPDGKGYWVVTASGRVFAYGDAARYPRRRRARAIIGIVSSPRGGYWLYTARGNVYSTPGASWYGSPAAGRFRGSSVTGMAPSPSGQGYWLVSPAGGVFAYGDAAILPALQSGHPVTGIAGG